MNRTSSIDLRWRYVAEILTPPELLKQKKQSKLKVGEDGRPITYLVDIAVVKIVECIECQPATAAPIVRMVNEHRAAVRNEYRKLKNAGQLTNATTKLRTQIIADKQCAKFSEIRSIGAFEESDMEYLVVEESRDATQGDEITLLGFPLKVGALTLDTKRITARQDGHYLVDMTASMGDGASGGPALNAAGAVIGILSNDADSLTRIRDIQMATPHHGLPSNITLKETEGLPKDSYCLAEPEESWQQQRTTSLPEYLSPADGLAACRNHLDKRDSTILQKLQAQAWKYDWLICNAAACSNAVRILYEQLRKRTQQVWFDEIQSQGAVLDVKMQAVAQAHSMLLFVDSCRTLSPEVQEQLCAAVSLEKAIFVLTDSRGHSWQSVVQNAPTHLRGCLSQLEPLPFHFDPDFLLQAVVDKLMEQAERFKSEDVTASRKMWVHPDVTPRDSEWDAPTAPAAFGEAASVMTECVAGEPAEVLRIGDASYMKCPHGKEVPCIYGTVSEAVMLSESAIGKDLRRDYGQLFVMKKVDRELAEKHLPNPEIERQVQERGGRLPSRMLEDVEAEARILQMLKQNPHRNIVTLRDIGHDETSLYIILDRVGCAGDKKEDSLHDSELHALVISSGGLHEKQAAMIFKGVVSGVAHLHRMGIVHHDLSLDNVLINYEEGNPRPVIIDFGLAQLCVQSPSGALCPLRPVGRLAGKPYYMAPEAYADNTNYDGVLADVWSLGVILAAMLTAQIVYKVPAKADARYAHLCEGINNQTGRVSPQVIEMLFPSHTLSRAVLDLLGSVLIPDEPHRRLISAQILAHPWCQRKIDEEELLAPPHWGLYNSTASCDVFDGAPEARSTNNSQVYRLEDDAPSADSDEDVGTPVWSGWKIFDEARLLATPLNSVTRHVTSESEGSVLGNYPSPAIKPPPNAHSMDSTTSHESRVERKNSGRGKPPALPPPSPSTPHLSRHHSTPRTPTPPDGNITISRWPTGASDGSSSSHPSSTALAPVSSGSITLTRQPSLIGVCRRDWEPDRPNCQICQKQFNRFPLSPRYRHHCRGCGKNVCAECSPRELALDTRFGYGGKRVRVCTNCWLKNTHRSGSCTAR